MNDQTTTTRTGLCLAAPWTVYFRELKAFFQNDPEVDITFDESAAVVHVHCDSADKAKLLEKYLPEHVSFGHAALDIQVHEPLDDRLTEEEATEIAERSVIDELSALFSGNQAFSYLKWVDNPGHYLVVYVVFKREVVSFFNDNVHDVRGFTSMLYEDLAEDIFVNREGIIFCTDTRDIDPMECHW